jgi:hypothetical protein
MDLKHTFYLLLLLCRFNILDKHNLHFTQLKRDSATILNPADTLTKKALIHISTIKPFTVSYTPQLMHFA